MATLSGFHGVIREKEMFFSGRKKLDFEESLCLGRGDGSFQYVRQVSTRAASSSAMIAPGTEGASGKTKGKLSKMKSASMASRGEPVMAFRKGVAVCVLASALLERVAARRGGSVLEEVSGSSSQLRELSSAGDSATASERSRLESQWKMFLSDSIDRDLSELELDGLREGEGEGEGEVIVEANLAEASSSQVGVTVSSGRPKARSRRLEARRERLSTSKKRTPIGAFTISPRSRAEAKSDHRKVEEVQGYVSTYLREMTKIDRLTGPEEVMLSKIIRIGYLMREQRKKLERAVGHELTKHQWADLLHVKVADIDTKLQEADLARDKMVMANLRLVLSVVKQYKCEGLELADLIQEGTIGLLKGVEKFDHTRGYKLSTYVHWWIRQGVTRAIAEHSRTIRLPVHVHDALGRIRRTRARMVQEGDTATVESLGQTLHLSNNQVMNALKVPKRLKSLDKQVGYQKNFLTGNDETFHSLIADQQDENQPWTLVERAQLKEDVDKILNTHLGSRERDIIKMHFGVDCEDGYPMSLENISHRFGISRERVRQVERAAKQKLQSLRHGLDKYCSMLI